jgi:transcriptional regulator with XRE-family HTH domain
MSDGDLGGFLRQSRVKVGLSQKDVAVELGYKSSQFVSNWERGLSSPPIGTFRRLCSLYQTSETEMFQKLKAIAIKKLEAELEREFFGSPDQTANRAEVESAAEE